MLLVWLYYSEEMLFGFLGDFSRLRLSRGGSCGLIKSGRMIEYCDNTPVEWRGGPLTHGTMFAEQHEQG